MLEQPECRLITIVAPGGSGKTRLAAEVGERFTANSGLPVRFVNLEPLGDGDVALAIADAFGVALPPLDRDAAEALADTLREQAALLILDNFEHLAETWAEVVGRLASRCPELRLLVTSRVSLNVQQEWRFSLEGLPVSVNGGGHEAAAVRLFLDRARQVSGRSDESFDMGAVSAICKAVDGMPLALEMAAAWSRSLGEAEIAREIGERLDLLTATMRDLPKRQQSIAAVFDQSLAMLDEEHRHVFLRLGAFGSSFGRGAAVEIAGASLPMLATLVDHSLVWARGEGRYRLHSLLRSYAREHLEAAGTLEDLQLRHSVFYLGFVERRLDDIMGRAQFEAMRDMNVEYDNLAQAWRHAIEAGNVDAAAAAAVPYAMFLDSTARYQEELAMNEDVFALAERGGDQRPALVGLAHALRAGAHLRLGNLDIAEADCHAAMRMRASGELQLPRGIQTNELAMLGLVALVRGNYDEAERWAAEAAAAAAPDDAMDAALAQYVASGAEFGRGNYAQARQFGEHSLALASGSGDSWFSGYVHLQLAECALAEQRYADATRHADRLRETREQFGDRQGVALGTLRLGDVALRERDFATARQRYLQASRLFRDLADRGGRATVLASLAQVDSAEGDMTSARARFLQALEEAEAVGYASALAQVFLGVAEMQIGAGDREGAAMLLAYLVHAPTTPRAISDDAIRLREGLGLPAVAQREAERAAAGLSLDDVCRALRKTLAARGRGKSADSANAPPMEQPELTRREVQVLALLDRGGTNSSVARDLGLTTNTVKWYCTQIFGKLNAQNRTAALARARELGLLA